MCINWLICDEELREGHDWNIKSEFYKKKINVNVNNIIYEFRMYS